MPSSWQTLTEGRADFEAVCAVRYPWQHAWRMYWLLRGLGMLCGMLGPTSNLAPNDLCRFAEALNDPPVEYWSQFQVAL